jgi:hypothetical protein
MFNANVFGDKRNTRGPQFFIVSSLLVWMDIIDEDDALNAVARDLYQTWHRAAILAWVNDKGVRDAACVAQRLLPEPHQDWPELIMALKKLGADVNYAMNRRRPLNAIAWAVHYNLPETLYRLLRLGSIPYGNPYNGRIHDPLYEAVRRNHVRCAKVLIDWGCGFINKTQFDTRLPHWFHDFSRARKRAMMASVALYDCLLACGHDSQTQGGSNIQPALAVQIARLVWNNRFRDEQVWAEVTDPIIDWAGVKVHGRHFMTGSLLMLMGAMICGILVAFYASLDPKRQ